MNTPCKQTILLLVLFAAAYLFLVSSAMAYEQAPALMDLRTTFSDGAYDPETLVQMAVEKGFRVIFLNDHDRVVMEYGLPPFRNIVKKKEELNSINKSGAGAYLRAIGSIRKKYPDVILIPGTESTPFYYWTGSPFAGNLTANDHERRILTMGLEKSGDYETLPILHNRLSGTDLRAAMPALLAFIMSFLLSIYFLFNKGWWRISGAVLIILNAGFFINAVFAHPSAFDAYHGKQGMAPYQLFIDAVSRKGGLTFWNYPETRSGVRKLGPIQVKTLPYPEVLLGTKNYTGFAALYGDTITITEPGNVWDVALQEYCRGFRARPPWGIATADYHKEGDSGQNLGDFQTVLWLRDKSTQSVLAALKNGKMYACQGKFPNIPRLDEFSVSAAEPDAAPRMISGDELSLARTPRIRITVSGGTEGNDTVQVRLIRSGTLIQTFRGTLPLDIDYTDPLETPGEKVYYRMDMTGYGIIVSNPIFVKFVK
ncbi:MAG: hypothetical protein KJ800_03470 [Proteobacteria bacterium]|nr:hypothetical protein [Pseudomonadota bacterium]MBU1184035.1 hypothetical protein [Pseudomonadota bacterium]MBU2027137.1 hypothetical protein [Pseudomonadota bacterium]MBU3931061.1 hypothetical protein [Pseudomonadota bacterium]